jgi:hypothetical protein
VTILVGCVGATYFDLTLRARVGQFLLKDQVSLVAAFTFVWGLENYVRVLLAVFCVHTLMPLELDLVEAVSLYQAWGVWLGHEILPAGLILSFLLGCGCILNGSMVSGGGALITSILGLMCVIHVVILSFLS